MAEQLVLFTSLSALNRNLDGESGAEGKVNPSGGGSDQHLVKTSVPGIYRRGSRYVVVYRDPQGRQRKRFARI